ncbi:d2780c11-3069-4c49-ae61-22495445d5f6-CDS [Sclerotinia trifoliorum]|uniref:D2780c11-3069-4c49-ae61-22495445d5f6-CDS n=1 Tax=Sclerotinia trifoliorum TaxID=28548 RepID=A0A8H2VVP1_9HELO|nr:d2780c11-3069-4c49-ae61-22495445d5f6-CDS [Sclerotinia trifoliorum]
MTTPKNPPANNPLDEYELHNTPTPSLAPTNTEIVDNLWRTSLSNFLNEDEPPETPTLYSASTSGVQDSRFSCTICPTTFDEKDQLDRHVAYHSKPFKCSRCARNFDRSHDLRHHQNATHGVRQHQCPYCASAFSAISSLDHHLKASHRSIRSFYCQQIGCISRQGGETFSNLGTCRRHMRIQHGLSDTDVMSYHGNISRPGSLGGNSTMEDA